MIYDDKEFDTALKAIIVIIDSEPRLKVAVKQAKTEKTITLFPQAIEKL